MNYITRVPVPPSTLILCNTVQHKTACLYGMLQEEEFDLALLTETQLEGNDVVVCLMQLTPLGYVVLHQPHIGGWGGGVAIVL